MKIAQTRQEEARLLYQQSLLNAGKEVNDALTAWQTAKSQFEINTHQVETLREAVRKTELLMRHSGTTYLEILTTQHSLKQRQTGCKPALTAYRVLSNFIMHWEVEYKLESGIENTF